MKEIVIIHLLKQIIYLFILNHFTVDALSCTNYVMGDIAPILPQTYCIFGISTLSFLITYLMTFTSTDKSVIRLYQPIISADNSSVGLYQNSNQCSNSYNVQTQNLQEHLITFTII